MLRYEAWRQRCNWSVASLFAISKQSTLPGGFLTFPFSIAGFATMSRVFKASLLFRSLGNHRRDGNMDPVPIYRHKREIGGTDVAFGAGYVILHPHLDADFHRGVKRAIDGGPKHQQ